MDSLPVTPLIRELCSVVVDLGGTPTAAERFWALLRLIALTGALIAGVMLFWSLPLGLPALAVLVLSGVIYSLLFVATHEMVHGTLLGWRRFETVLACLISWPMSWPHLTYTRLHRLHHRWNGLDPRDPERTDVLPAERLRAGPLRSWIHRHVLLWRIVVLGGLGFIIDTACKGKQLQSVDQGLAQAQRIDAIGVVLWHSVVISVAAVHGQFWRYVLLWLVLERVIGAILQFRGLVEHHGLWHSEGPPLLTQLYSTRTVNAGVLLNALMGGLPHHCAHHAFPWIPSSRLPVATQRINAVLERHGAQPIPMLKTYREALVKVLV